MPRNNIDIEIWFGRTIKPVRMLTIWLTERLQSNQKCELHMDSQNFWFFFLFKSRACGETKSWGKNADRKKWVDLTTSSKHSFLSRNLSQQNLTDVIPSSSSLKIIMADKCRMLFSASVRTHGVSIECDGDRNAIIIVYRMAAHAWDHTWMHFESKILWCIERFSTTLRVKSLSPTHQRTIKHQRQSWGGTGIKISKKKRIYSVLHHRDEDEVFVWFSTPEAMRGACETSLTLNAFWWGFGTDTEDMIATAMTTLSLFLFLF